MTKTRQNIWFKSRIRLTLKTICCALLMCVILIVTISVASAQLSVQPLNATSSGTQFEVDVAFAYVGATPANASYMTSNCTLMSPVSQYSSAVVINSTRIHGEQFASCDAEIEVYNVKIATERGWEENFYYFIGTNYVPNVSILELSSLSGRVRDLTSSGPYIVTGDFKGNMTDNMSILSSPIGSIGVYSNHQSSPGLWNAGKPNAISVTIQRVGYLTVSDGSVSTHKDQTNKPATATLTLSNYGNGFLHNQLVPEAKLPQTNLFNPKP